MIYVAVVFELPLTLEINANIKRRHINSVRLLVAAASGLKNFLHPMDMNYWFVIYEKGRNDVAVAFLSVGNKFEFEIFFLNI